MGLDCDWPDEYLAARAARWLNWPVTDCMRLPVYWRDRALQWDAAEQNAREYRKREEMKATFGA